MIDTKNCFKCGQKKPCTEFYKHSKMADGYLGKCKSCTKADSKANLDEKLKDPEFVEKEHARHRDKYHRLGYKDIHKPTKEAKREAIRRYKEKFPEMIKATSAMNGHKKTEKGFNYHHWSYNQQHYRDTIVLSIKDHNTAHRFLVYDQQFFMYKDKQGNLLDTREKHEAYIREMIAKHS